MKIDIGELNIFSIISWCLYSWTHIGISEAVGLQILIKYVL